MKEINENSENSNSDPEISTTKQPVKPENKVYIIEEKIDNDKNKESGGGSGEESSKGTGEKDGGQKTVAGSSIDGEREKITESKLDRILSRILPPWF